MNQNREKCSLTNNKEQIQKAAQEAHPTWRKEVADAFTYPGSAVIDLQQKAFIAGAEWMASQSAAPATNEQIRAAFTSTPEHGKPYGTTDGYINNLRYNLRVHGLDITQSAAPVGEAPQAFRQKVIELLWSHYKENGGYTRLAASFIEKLTGEKWERDHEYQELAAEVERLKGEADRLREQRDALQMEHDALKQHYEVLSRELSWAQEVVQPDLISQLKEREWVSVKDRLPEDRQKVLAFGYWPDSEAASIIQAKYYSEDSYNRPSFVSHALTLKHVSHWMPLPLPPKPQTEHE